MVSFTDNGCRDVDEWQHVMSSHQRVNLSWRANRPVFDIFALARSMALFLFCSPKEAFGPRRDAEMLHEQKQRCRDEGVGSCINL